MFLFKIEIVNDSIVQPAPNEVAKDGPVQTVDKSVSYDFSEDEQSWLETRRLDLTNLADKQADQSSSDTQRDFAEGSRCGKAHSTKDFWANKD